MTARLNSRRGSALRTLCSLLGLIAAVAGLGTAAAQHPTRLPTPDGGDVLHAPAPVAGPAGGACAPPQSGFPPNMQLVQPTPPRPVEPFVESLKGNDALIEIVVGQGRLLTLKQDI